MKLAQRVDKARKWGTQDAYIRYVSKASKARRHRDAKASKA